MKRTLILLLLLTLTFIPVQTRAVELGGDFELRAEHRENMDDEHPNLESVLNLTISHSTWTNGFEMDIDFLGDLKQESFDIELGEAYYEYFGDDYDLKVGRQVKTRGAANEFNPTDVLNPMDSAELFADKEPVLMLSGKYYPELNYELSGVVIPYHVPAREEFNGFKARSVEDELENSELALRLAGKGVEGIDFSLMAFRGFEDLPTAGMKQTPDGPMPDPNNIFYREYTALGGDLAGSYEGIGYWLEGAYMIPDDGEEYWSLVAGGDYNFADGLFVTGQIIHQKDKLLNEDTLLQAAVEQTVAQIHTLRLGAVFNPDTEGYLLKPEFEYSLADATTLTASYQYHEGELLSAAEMLGERENKLEVSLNYAF